MTKHVLIINGHPDPSPARFCAALCETYSVGVEAGGGEPRLLNLGVRSEFLAPLFDDLLRHIEWADRVAMVFPLWLDAPPPALNRLLSGESADPVQAICRSRMARLIVTMSMPAFIYRGISRAPQGQTPCWMKAADMAHTSQTFIGSVDALSAAQRNEWLNEIRHLGSRDSYSPKWPRKSTAKHSAFETAMPASQFI